MTLEERLENAISNLSDSARTHWNAGERIRLQGKVEGIELALSYVREGSARAVVVPTTDLYFEAHVTIDPAKDEEWEADLRDIAATFGFRVAELLMKKGGERSRLDDFMTARSGDYDDILDRTHRLVDALVANGYAVRRWKVENTLLDVRLQP